MVDNEYKTDNCKSSKISIGVIIKNPEMLKFVPDHLKTKKMCKHAVKKLPFAIRYDIYKTQQMYNKSILEIGGMLESVRDRYKTQEMCDKAVDSSCIKICP